MSEKINTEEFQKIMADVLEAYEKLQNKKYLDKYIENKFKYYPNIKNNKSELYYCFFILFILSDENARNYFFEDEKIKLNINKIFTHYNNIEKYSTEIPNRVVIESINNPIKILPMIIFERQIYLLNKILKSKKELNIEKESIIKLYGDVINNIPKIISDYILSIIGDDKYLLFNDIELSILRKNGNDSIFDEKYSNMKNISNFKNTIELFAYENRLNLILDKVKSIVNKSFKGYEISLHLKMSLIIEHYLNEDIRKKIIKEIDIEIKNIIEEIKKYMIKETGIKHLFDSYEFRIFGEPISNFELLNEQIKKYSNHTEDNFKTITDKKCLILHLDKNAVIKSLDNDKEYDIDSVNGYFPIFNGINYKGNKHYNELVYMEI